MAEPEKKGFWAGLRRSMSKARPVASAGKLVGYSASLPLRETPG